MTGTERPPLQRGDIVVDRDGCFREIRNDANRYAGEVVRVFRPQRDAPHALVWEAP